jgi:hypothetical protein
MWMSWHAWLVRATRRWLHASMMEFLNLLVAIASLLVAIYSAPSDLTAIKKTLCWNDFAEFSGEKHSRIFDV